jgi:hypothetical protein
MNSNHKNILIVFDAFGYAPVSMHVATELAVKMQTGIHALYIEDNNLLNAVELPFTREVSLHTAAISNIDSSSMMQQFRADAENIKKQIEEIALTNRVSLSFSSMRGQKIQAIRNRTEEVNMVIIPAAYSIRDREQHAYTSHEIILVYESNSPSSEKALNIALSQVAKQNHQLIIIVDNDKSKQLVEKILSHKGEQAVCQIADFSSLDEIILLLYKHAPALLVLPDDSSLVHDETMLKKLINSVESDILLIS